MQPPVRLPYYLANISTHYSRVDPKDCPALYSLVASVHRLATKHVDTTPLIRTKYASEEKTGKQSST